MQSENKVKFSQIKEALFISPNSCSFWLQLVWPTKLQLPHPLSSNEYLRETVIENIYLLHSVTMYGYFLKIGKDSNTVNYRTSNLHLKN